jgi:hypothetical protein
LERNRFETINGNYIDVRTEMWVAHCRNSKKKSSLARVMYVSI